MTILSQQIAKKMVQWCFEDFSLFTFAPLMAYLLIYSVAKKRSLQQFYAYP